MDPNMNNNSYGGPIPGTDMSQSTPAPGMDPASPYNFANPGTNMNAGPVPAGNQPWTAQPAPKKKKDSKVASVLGIILLIGLAVFLIATAIVDLVSMSGVKKLASESVGSPDAGSYVELTSSFGGEAGTMKHTINFIPVGTEYYYILFNDDFTQAIFVRADKKLKNSFNSSGLTTSPVTVKGKIRTMDYKLKKELANDVNSMSANGIDVAMSDKGEYYFIDAMTTKISVLKLAGFGFLVIAIIFCFLLTKLPVTQPGEKSNQTQKSVYGAIAAIGFVAGAILILHIISTYY